MSKDLGHELCELINREISLDPTVVVEADTDLLLTGTVDSLGVVQIVHWMEARLGRRIDPIDVVLDNFQTVEAMVRYCDRVTAAP
jgi:acyl carrier protein